MTLGAASRNAPALPESRQLLSLSPRVAVVALHDAFAGHRDVRCLDVCLSSPAFYPLLPASCLVRLVAFEITGGVRVRYLGELGVVVPLRRLRRLLRGHWSQPFRVSFRWLFQRTVCCRCLGFGRVM